MISELSCIISPPKNTANKETRKNLVKTLYTDFILKRFTAFCLTNKCLCLPEKVLMVVTDILVNTKILHIKISFIQNSLFTNVPPLNMCQ